MPLYFGTKKQTKQASPLKNYQKLSKRIQENPTLQVEVYEDFITYLLSQPNQIFILVSRQHEIKINWYTNHLLYFFVYNIVGFYCSLGDKK